MLYAPLQLIGSITPESVAPDISTVPVKVGDSSGALDAIELVTVVAKLASSLSAAASSFRVSSAAGAESTMLVLIASRVTKYCKATQFEEPFPILNFPVSVSKPNSPAARIGLEDVQVAAVPRRTRILV
jgi:hypothetical protein